MEEFYEELEETIKKIPKKDLLIVMETGMPKSVRMQMTSGQEQSDILDWEDQQLWTGTPGVF